LQYLIILPFSALNLLITRTEHLSKWSQCCRADFGWTCKLRKEHRGEEEPFVFDIFFRNKTYYDASVLQHGSSSQFAVSFVTVAQMMPKC